MPGARRAPTRPRWAPRPAASPENARVDERPHRRANSRGGLPARASSSASATIPSSAWTTRWGATTTSRASTCRSSLRPRSRTSAASASGSGARAFPTASCASAGWRSSTWRREPPDSAADSAPISPIQAARRATSTMRCFARSSPPGAWTSHHQRPRASWRANRRGGLRAHLGCADGVPATVCR